MPQRKPPRASGCRTVAWLMLFVILGIPTVIAYRAYRTIQVRSEVAEGVSLAKRCRSLVDDYYASHRVLPLDDGQAGLPGSHALKGRFVEGAHVRDGNVIVAFGEQADGRIAGSRLVYSPRADADRLKWSCGTPAGTTLEPGLRPPECRP
jgi:hypothetical protein